MSLFTALLPIVGGLFGKSNKPDVPVAQPAVPLSNFQSALDVPATDLYTQQILGNLGYQAKKTGGDTRYTGIAQQGDNGYYLPGFAQMGQQGADVLSKYYATMGGGNAGQGATQADYDAFVKAYGPQAAQAVWSKTTSPTGWEFAQASEPEAYAQIRNNYNRELASQQNKMLAGQASRGMFNSGATAELQRKMSGDTSNAISNAIEENRQKALAQLNNLIGSERDQQYKAAVIANKGSDTNFANANTTYGNELSARQGGIDELASLLGGLGKVKLGTTKKAASPSYTMSPIWNLYPDYPSS
jgi:hypothetical protein